MKKRTWLSSFLLLLSVPFLFTGGCTGTYISVGNTPEHHNPYYDNPGRGGGPPPWAPAHGYRAKYKYRYYPSTEVYFDVDRNFYFYFSDGNWQVTKRLPFHMKAGLGNSVVLEMATDKPYRYHSDVVKRYPPGLTKNRGKGK